jgi:flavin reductase (DIM6/NTAB) family NADH-FMN oxidoreductase RutF/DNA-binding IclR family transcriptional regulator
VTTRDRSGAIHGLTANSFSSVSLEPPLVLWSQSHSSRSHAAFLESDHFAINILAEDQVALSNLFAKSAVEDKFAGLNHDSGVGGVPVLKGTAAHLECEKIAMYPGGDHTVYLGRVERIGSSGLRPLVFEGGRYAVAYAHDVGPLEVRTGALASPSAALVRRVEDALPGLAARLGEHTLCLCVWGNRGPTTIHWEPSAKPVSSELRLGLVMNVTASASGRAFAAFLPEQVTQTFVGEDLRLFRTAGLDAAAQRQALDAEMAATREKGIARAAGLWPAERLHGVTTNAFSVPIVDDAGRMVMALTVVSPADRLSDDWDGAVPCALKDAARTFAVSQGAPCK